MTVEAVTERAGSSGKGAGAPRGVDPPGRLGPGGPVRERRDTELAGEGWVRRFVGGPPRLLEMTELYESLGHEVLLDPLTPGELGRRCGDCALALELFRVVYTRSRS